MANNKKRILLVDDDDSIIESMRVVLESKGYEILIAHDGTEGLEKAEGANPDLLVLDMMMPRRSGFMVLDKLKQSRRRLPVIMITANEGTRHQRYARLLGVSEYMQKPFTMDKLVKAVETQLN